MITIVWEILIGEKFSFGFAETLKSSNRSVRALWTSMLKIPDDDINAMNRLCIATLTYDKHLVCGEGVLRDL